MSCRASQDPRPTGRLKERVRLRVAVELGGTSSRVSPSSLASSLEAWSPHLGRVQDCWLILQGRARSHPSESLVSVKSLPLVPVGVETPWQQLMDGLGP